jgi:Ca2+-dependent lipid-binding protein
VFLKLGPLRVMVPVHVSNIQFKVLSRIILHMVDTFPCIGGATVTLLSVPHWDATVKVFGCPIDMMALPGVKFIANYITEVCGPRGGHLEEGSVLCAG